MSLPNGSVSMFVKNGRNVYLNVGNQILSPYKSNSVQFGTLNQIEYFLSLMQKGMVTTNDALPQEIVDLLLASGFTYTGPVAPTPGPTVTISTLGGIYNTAQTISLITASGNTIYYTIDGSTPTASSVVYSAPITISSTTTLKYFAKDNLGNVSNVYSVTYTIDTQAPDAFISIPGGLYNATQSVSLASNATNPSIYYTTDGTMPTTSSTLYKGPISIIQTTTLKFFVKDGAGNTSAVQTVTYTIDKVAPTVTASIPAGTYSTNQSVTLTPSEGASVFYTLDGSQPSQGSTAYSAPILISQTSTLKFFARDLAGNVSQTYSLSYVIDTTAPTVVASLPGGTYNSYQSVVLNPSKTGSTVYYTTDGSFPTVGSNIYTTPIAIQQTTTLKFFAKDVAGNTSSVYTVVYTIQLPSNNGGGGTGGGTSDMSQKDYMTAAEEPFNGNGTITKTFSHEMDYFVIHNDDVSVSLTFTIGNETITVDPGENFDQRFSPFNSVTVTTNGSFRAYGKRIIGSINKDDLIVADGCVGNSNTTKTLSGNMRLAVIENKGTSVVTVVVNGFSFIVNPNESLNEMFSPFQTITINATDKFHGYFEGLANDIADVTPPDNVGALAPSNITTTSARLNWNAATASDLAGYNVYNGTTKLNTALIAGLYFDVTSLSANTLYNFKVTSLDTTGNESSGTMFSVTTASQAPTPDTTPPANVAGLAYSNLTDTSLTLNWNAVGDSDLAGYNAYNGSSKMNNALITGISYPVSSLTASTLYNFKVTSVDTSNNESSGSLLSVTTNAPAVPSGTVAWTYDFIVPASAGTYNLKTDTNFTHTLTNVDVYGPALDGVGGKVDLLELGVQDGAKDEPGQKLPRDGVDSFTAPSIHGGYQFDETAEVIYFDSMAMNPYYFRIVKYV